LAAFSRASPPLAGPKERAAKIATRRTAARVETATRRAARNASESRAAAIVRARAGVASYAMPDVHFYTATDSGDWIIAGAAIVVAFLIAHLVDRIISKRGAQVGELVSRGEISPATQTRLRLIRRLVYALFLVIGLAVAASQIDGVSGLAKGILASSAVLGIVIGFAARQTLANGIAGILLAITQPIRIGDLVTFEEETGVVEDMKLTYTYIRLEDGRRLIVPNERLAQSSVVNHTILDPRVQVEVSVWLPLDADLDKAMELIRNDAADVDVSVVEVDKEGVRLSATTWASGPSERGKTAAEMRLRWLRQLREHQLSSTEA
jgi:small-conductance mechanosensitive channel